VHIQSALVSTCSESSYLWNCLWDFWTKKWGCSEQSGNLRCATTVIQYVPYAHPALFFWYAVLKMIWFIHSTHVWTNIKQLFKHAQGIFRPHRLHEIRTVVTYMRDVCLWVCLGVIRCSHCQITLVSCYLWRFSLPEPFINRSSFFWFLLVSCTYWMFCQIIIVTRKCGNYVVLSPKASHCAWLACTRPPVGSLTRLHGAATLSFMLFLK